MASDRSPLSKRLKSLAQRAGLPVDDVPPAERDHAVTAAPAAPTTPAVPPAAEAPADEQPTGDIPAVAEPTTDEQPVLRIADEQPTITSDAVPAEADVAPSPDPFAHEDGPTLAPPVVPARATPEPSAGADAAPERPGAPADDDDEPFSPRSTIWPQSAPTPRFERRDARPAAHSTADPTFPAASPAAADEDDSAVEPVEAAAPTEPAPAAEPAAAPASSIPETPTDAPVASAAPARAVEVPATDDATIDQPALPADAPTGKTGVFGSLRRLRPVRDRASSAGETPAVAAAAPSSPSEPATPAAEPAPAPIAAEQPYVAPAAPYEPPAKPSFAERASLRRRAKTLRARRDAGLLELGAIVLDQRRFGDPTGGSLTRRRTDELADLDSELAAIEQVLDDDGPAETVAQLGVVRCLSCTALVGPRDRFCVQCGAPRPEGDGSPSNAA